MNEKKIKTIKELLMSTNYPMAWIQGHHTRIIVLDDGEFRTLAYDGIKYVDALYMGMNEEQAVKIFIENEES